MKRLSFIGIVVLIMALALSGCGASETGGVTEGAAGATSAPAAADLADGARLSVVATTSIVGDIVRNVGGEAIDLTVLLPAGTSPHSFSPTPQDVAAVSDADVVIANGAGLEEFLAAMIESAGDVPVVELSEGIALQESAAHHHEGEGEEADHEEGEDADHEEEDEGATDPHIWTTPANGVVMAQNAAQAFSALDPANAEVYDANAAAYVAELNEMDEWIQAEIDTIPAENRKLVTDHLAFGYYCSRYGLEQVGAVIPSFTTEAGTSAQELAALEDTMRAEGVQALFVDGAINSDVADALAADLGVQTVPLYTGSLGTEGSDVDTYLDYLQYNTTAIVSALQ